MGSKVERGPQTDKTPATKSHYRSNFLDIDIWHCFLSSLILLQWGTCQYVVDKLLTILVFSRSDHQSYNFGFNPPPH